MDTPRKYPPIATLDRLRKWCAMQERAHSDVRRKLYSWGVYGNEVEGVVAELISDNYLNEERYARAFAQGKFRIKKWGWRKIEVALRQKGISAYSMRAAKDTFDSHEHGEVLLELLLKKRDMLHESDPYKLKAKLLRYAMGKGYDFAEAQATLDQLPPAGSHDQG
jgi:regulatory protein